MEEMKGQKVHGRTIQYSVANPWEDKKGGRGRGGVGHRQEVDGATLFVHNVTEDTPTDDLFKVFWQHGLVTDVYNPGKGSAFVTFPSAAEAKTAMEAMEGQKDRGRTIQYSVAKPREDKNGGKP